MSENQNSTSQQDHHSLDEANLTEEFNKNLFISDKNSSESEVEFNGPRVSIKGKQIEGSNNTVPNQNSSQNKPLQVLRINKKPKLVEKSISIIVLSDGQEEQIFHQKINEEKTKMLVEEAVLSGSKFNILKTLYKQYVLKEKTQRQKQEAFKRLILAYFLQNANINIKNGYFKNRIQAPKKEQYLQSQYILYGVDMISTKSLMKMFFNQHPTIKWIDSSHCKLVFDSKLLGWQTIIDNRKQPKQGYDDFGGNLNLKTEGKQVYEYDMEFQDQDQTEIDLQIKQRQRIKKHFVVLKNYIQLSQYYQLGFKRKLYIRNATLSQILLQQNNKQEKNIQIQERQQIDNQNQSKDQGFNKFKQIKQSFEDKLMSAPIVKLKFEEITQKIQRDKMKRRKTHFNSSFNSKFNPGFKKTYQNNYYENHNDNKQYERRPNQRVWRDNNRRFNKMQTQTQEGYPRYKQYEQRNSSRTRTRDQRRQTRQQRNQRNFDDYLKGTYTPNQNRYEQQNNNNYRNSYEQNTNNNRNQYNNNQHYGQTHEVRQQYNPNYNQYFPLQQVNHGNGLNMHQSQNNNFYPTPNNIPNNQIYQHQSNHNFIYQPTSIQCSPHNVAPNFTPQNPQNYMTNQNMRINNGKTQQAIKNKKTDKDPFKSNALNDVSYVDKVVTSNLNSKNSKFQQSLSQQFRSDLQFSESELHNSRLKDSKQIQNTQLQYKNNLGSLLNALDNEQNYEHKKPVAQLDPQFSEDQNSDLQFIYKGANQQLKIQTTSNQISNIGSQSIQASINKAQNVSNELKFQKNELNGQGNTSMKEKQQKAKNIKPVKKKKITVQNLNKMKPNGDTYLDLQN